MISVNNHKVKHIKAKGERIMAKVKVKDKHGDSESTELHGVSDSKAKDETAKTRTQKRLIYLFLIVCLKKY